MKISVISFTRNGQKLSQKLKKSLNDFPIQLFTKSSAVTESYSEIELVGQSIGEWTRNQMQEKNVLVFIGACGIAVRAIAPNLISKLEDSPVIVIDEKGHYVIPILSGHFGGANELSILIAEKIGAEPVITTATDVNQKFAIDIFAKKNKLTIVNKSGIAKVSAKVLCNETIKIAIENGHWKETKSLLREAVIVSYPPEESADVVISSEKRAFDASLILIPQEYTVGVGCKKGKEPEKLEQFIGKTLQNMGIDPKQIAAISSVDVMAEEPAMNYLSRKYRIPFITYTGEELEQMDGEFSESEFVRKTIGVGNVCERAALKTAGEGGELILRKCAEDGMTIAIAKRKWSVIFNEK